MAIRQIDFRSSLKPSKKVKKTSESSFPGSNWNSSQPDQEQPNLQNNPGAYYSPADTNGNPGAADTGPTDLRAEGCLYIYHDRLKRMQGEQDPALKVIFQAELDIIKETMDTMGISPEGSGTAPSSEPADTTPQAPPANRLPHQSGGREAWR